MSILVAGQNDVNQLSSGKSDTSSPSSIGIKFHNIVSYSIYSQHAVMVTSSGVPSCIGDNTNFPIYANLGKHLNTWTSYTIKENGKNYLVESAVCGLNYTLYLVKESANDKTKSLFYVQRNKKKGHPYILNTNGWTIVSIYGGCETAAGIDERGAIHIIPFSIVTTKKNETTVVFLPNMSLAISIAFQENFIVALSSYHSVYTAEVSTGDFQTDTELENQSIKSISGINCHCIALGFDGSVFIRGKNEDGRLGSGNKTNSSIFQQIAVLKNQEIVEASAGAFHSLFINKIGKVYACGFDGFGEALQGDSTDADILAPKTTVITKGARFCIAGHQCSVVFVDCEIPQKSPNRALQLVDSFPYPCMFKANIGMVNLDRENKNLKNTNKQLQAAHDKLKNANSRLKVANCQLKNTNKQLKCSNITKTKEIVKLRKEIKELRSKYHLDKNDPIKVVKKQDPKKSSEIDNSPKKFCITIDIESDEEDYDDNNDKENDDDNNDKESDDDNNDKESDDDNNDKESDDNNNDKESDDNNNNDKESDDNNINDLLKSDDDLDFNEFNDNDGDDENLDDLY